MKKLLCMSLLISLFMQMTFAQTEQIESYKLSLSDATDFAIEHNKTLQSSRLNIELRNKQITEAISQGLPQINGSVDYTTNFNYETEIFGTKNKLEDQSSFTLVAKQLLFNGQWIVGLQTSKLARTLAQQEVELSVLDIYENIYNTYYTILVSERLFDILAENITNMEDVQKHTQNMYDAGVSEQTDVDQIIVTVNQLKNSLLSMKRTIDVSYNLLRLQLGIKAGTEVELTESLETFLVDDYTLALSQKEFNISDNVQYQVMQTQEDIQHKTLTMEKWSYAPSLSATYMFTERLIKPTIDFSPKHMGALTLDIPVFSGLQRKSKVAQEKIILEQVQINKSLLEDQLYLNEVQLKFNLRNAFADYSLQKENIEVSKRVLMSYQNKYNVGTISSLDLTQANNNYLSAESNYTSACLTLLQAQVALEKLYNEFKNN